MNNDSNDRMTTTAAELAAQAEADFQEVVRVVTYALEDLEILDRDKWFKHEDTQHTHLIQRNGEEFTFSKNLYSMYKPTHIGFVLSIPLRGKLTNFSIWVTDPVEDTAVNKRAAVRALEKLKSMRNLKLAQVSTMDLE